MCCIITAGQTLYTAGPVWAAGHSLTPMIWFTALLSSREQHGNNQPTPPPCGCSPPIEPVNERHVALAIYSEHNVSASYREVADEATTTSESNRYFNYLMSVSLN